MLMINTLLQVQGQIRKMRSYDSNKALASKYRILRSHNYPPLFKFVKSLSFIFSYYRSLDLEADRMVAEADKHGLMIAGFYPDSPVICDIRPVKDVIGQ